jgi:hypothetical protein
MRRLRQGGLLGVLLAFALVAAGCHRATGGGWIPSASLDGSKATFGVTAKCAVGSALGPGPTFYEGQFEWDDQGAGVRFHADIEPEIAPAALTGEEGGALPEEVFGGGFGFPPMTASPVGDYRPQPPGAPGRFTLFLTDAGEPGINGDTVTIFLSGGQYNEYTNTGTIQGGNIQVD